jgi:hypothetical protein
MLFMQKDELKRVIHSPLHSSLAAVFVNIQKVDSAPNITTYSSNANIYQ